MPGKSDEWSTSRCDGRTLQPRAETLCAHRSVNSRTRCDRHSTHGLRKRSLAFTYGARTLRRRGRRGRNDRPAFGTRKRIRGSAGVRRAAHAPRTARFERSAVRLDVCDVSSDRRRQRRVRPLQPQREPVHPHALQRNHGLFFRA